MNRDIFDLKNKVVVLTGGLGLLGKNFIDALKDKNAQSIVLDVADKTDISGITYIKTDVADKSSLEKARAEILAKFKKIDVLINSAALTHKVEYIQNEQPRDWSFENLNLVEWNREIEVNLTGTMLCSQVMGQAMTAGGSIINMASVYGLVAPDQSIYQEGYQQPATYGVTKAGIIYLTKYLAAYWGKRGIRVNAIAPGGTENNQNPEFMDKYSKKTPLGRMARPHEVNGAIIYLASEASSYVTGSVISIDGGWTAW